MGRKRDRGFAWEVGDRICRLRTEKGMSQRCLATALGSQGNELVARWERGESVPSAMTLIKLSELFGVSTDYILKGEEDAVPED